ncbi:MAG: hypothetical protein II288_03975 [Alistipes sp.]|nr:hypothetical protein [Alistipes sp.]
MSVLSWGKPKVEYAKSVNGAASTDWEEFPEIVEGTTQLETTEGALVEAPEEGGDIVDSRRPKNKYKFSFELYVKKGDKKPIEDEDGVIIDNYAVRLTPEDPECEGFLIDKANVSIVETFNSADGKRWRYTFDVIKPASGKMLKPYTAGAAE